MRQDSTGIQLKCQLITVNNLVFSASHLIAFVSLSILLEFFSPHQSNNQTIKSLARIAVMSNATSDSVSVDRGCLGQ